MTDEWHLGHAKIASTMKRVYSGTEKSHLIEFITRASIFIIEFDSEIIIIII